MDTCPACGKRFSRVRGTGIPYACPHCGEQILGRFRSLELIGRGAMAEVYRAEQPEMARRLVAAARG